ncbi:multicopper oxidase domain-containing protein [Bacillus pumilus]|uniref:multicopper oxidase family protein n=1 Tax=Bacillus pumilus TaxID=1408 RepID=UPI001D032750|nr:multicopper oxidase domain-containing protein [Bacillus pumilus]UDF17191.1 multicopper oxidase domain-containing protein [Bacillus pumilus]
MNLEKFVDELPIPEVAKPVKKNPRQTYYEIAMEEVFLKVHRDLPPTKLWTYNGSLPGPTIHANRNEKVKVKWMNKLPLKHFLPVDHTIHEGHHDEPEVKTVVHLHGGVTPASSDGYPEAWFSRDFEATGPFFEREVYEYPNHQQACTLWYHDHAMALTRLNVYAGLAGFYLISDAFEKSLELPKGEYDIPLMIMDRTFQEDGALFYPSRPNNTPEDSDIPDPSIVPFFCGETILVNGKVWPYLEVEPRKYRFRILNASNTRTYELHLDNDVTILQIGSDGGFLPRPVHHQSFSIAPAERFDVIIDFSAYENKTIILKNKAGCGQEVNPETDANIMQFKVTRPLKGRAPKTLRPIFKPLPPLRPSRADKERTLTLSGTQDKYGRPILLLDNQFWNDPVTENPRLGSVEVWSIVNPTRVTHPIHLHLVQFRVIDRRPFDTEVYQSTGDIVYTGPNEAPPLHEQGYKDTIQAHAGEVIRIIARFVPYSGRYVWHCHILEHEDYDMMRPMDIIK